MDVTLRPVVDSDLPVFFEHQRDPEGVAMAGVPSRDEEAFFAHWEKVRDVAGVAGFIFMGALIAAFFTTRIVIGRRRRRRDRDLMEASGITAEHVPGAVPNGHREPAGEPVVGEPAVSERAETLELEPDPD